MTTPSITDGTGGEDHRVVDQESPGRQDAPGAPATALSMRGVGKRFGQEWVMRGLDLDVPDGTILGLIGPSGCGKTTTVRLATGVLLPDEGEVHVHGRPPHLLDGSERGRIGYLPQEPVLFDELSLWENLTFHASLSGVRFRRRRHLRRLLDLVELGGDRRKLVRQASGGMKRRLALAAALVHDPTFILLDEPTAGIDPVLRRTFWEHFRSLRDEGRSLIITTQYVGEAADCDVVALLAGGNVVALGGPEELRRQAVGGELLAIETDRPADTATLAELRSNPSVERITTIGPVRLEILVDDGGSALPLVTARLEADGLRIVDSEEVVPSFDEVFIRLVGEDEPEITS
ncbi:MAG: ATP-binding cassette domain-containing protein [Acidimicrobiales bacterium]